MLGQELMTWMARLGILISPVKSLLGWHVANGSCDKNKKHCDDLFSC